MKIHRLQCPTCTANLEIEDGIDIFYCKYCGTKVIVTGQDKEAVKGKTKIKITEENNLQKRFEIEENHRQERFILEHQTREKIREENRSSKIIFECIAIMLIMIIAILAYYKFSEKNETDRLATIVAEIQIDIENGDYDAALAKTNELYYHGHEGLKERLRWDRQRKALQKTIRNAMKSS